MKLSPKAQTALQKVVDQFKSGDLSPIVKIARLRRRDDIPSAKWTFSNQVLAYIQTGTLDCRGYRQWQKAGRHVTKGSRAAYILAPLLVKKEDENGETRQVLVGFRPVAVFAATCTDGDPIPEIDYTPQELPPLHDAATRLGVTVTWQPLPPDRLGDCTVDGSEIRIGTHDTKTFFHELAHAAHARVNGGSLAGGQQAGQETIAEFTAAVLMELYGLGDRSGNTWKYIRSYAKDPLTAIIKAVSTVEQVLALLLQE